MGVTITTAATTLTSAGRRWVDRAPDGTLWAMVRGASSTTLTFWYSLNSGTTWQAATGTIAGVASPAAMFVDLDGGINVAYTISAGTPSKFRRGIYTAGTITWSAELSLTAINGTAEDVVAFRNPIGGGWIAVVAGRNADDGSHWLERVNITAANVPTTAHTIRLTVEGQIQGGTGFNGTVDFHHTGDGKTVQGGTPHIYVSWVDSYNRNWFRKLTWMGTYYNFASSGWYEISPSGTGTIPYLAFDGTRIVIAREESTGVKLYERDAGNTATIDRGTAPTFAFDSADPVTVSYDREGNVYLLATQTTSDDLYYVKWTRTTASWGQWTLVIAAVAPGTARLRVGWHSGTSTFPIIEGVYVDSTNLKYQTVAIVNAAPYAPTVTAPADSTTADVNTTLTVMWTFNDPDPGDAQTAYTLRRRISDVYTFWNGTSWASLESGATKIANVNGSQILSSGWGADSDADHHYSVKTWDALAQVSPWSAETRVVPSAKDNPAISDPATNGFDITTATFTVHWTVASQTRYRIRLIDDVGGTPNPGTVDFDSGIVNSVAARAHQISLPVNNETRQIELTTWNDEGLQSTTVYRIVDVVYTPPGTPTMTFSTSAVPGAIRVTVDNPSGGVTVGSNDLLRRIVGTASEIRVGTGLAIDAVFTDWAVASGVNYEYRVKAVATTGATALSAWDAT